MKYQVAIIGGGPAGYTAAETGGKAGLSVVLFEKAVSLPRPCCIRQRRMMLRVMLPNMR